MHDTEMIRLLKGLDKRWCRAGEAKVCENLRGMLEIDWKEVSSILVYKPEYSGEVDVASFILGASEHIKRYLVRSYTEPLLVYLYLPLADSELTTVHRFSFERSIGERIVAIIPGLTFDREGRRLPFPQDSFARFFSHPLANSVVRVGVCWSFQLSQEPLVGRGEVDFIVTELGVTRTVPV
jgi:5-formyltetrahydrofolate cyclo-ligase